MHKKTHEQFLPEIGAEMRDDYIKINGEIDRFNNQYNLSEQNKQFTIKKIKDNFEEARPGYQEAQKSARYEGSNKAKKKLQTPKKYYGNNILAKAEEEVRNDKIFEHLKGDRDGILNVLKEKFVTVEENAEVMGYKGKKVHINLPAVGKFKGFKFDYFVSDYKVGRNDFKPGLGKKLYTINDVSKLLEAMNRFMAELECDTDGSMDYEERLKSWQRYSESKCKAGDCLKAITGLNDCYRLNHYPVMIGWYCYSSSCNFDRLDYYSSNYLFLKLSD